MVIIANKTTFSRVFLSLFWVFNLNNLVKLKAFFLRDILLSGINGNESFLATITSDSLADVLKQTPEGRARLEKKENGISSPAILNDKRGSVNLIVNIIMELDPQFKKIQAKLVDFKLKYARSAMDHSESEFRARLFDFYDINHINTVINIGPKLV